jgi:DNA-binding NtrC family response regulator
MTVADTLPYSQNSLPIVGLAVVVAEGPDRGRRAAASESLSIGTGPNNDLVLTDNTVSRHHLELTRSKDRIAVKDLSSTNGTFFSGASIRDVDLIGGGRLRIGNTTLHVTDGDPTELELYGDDHLGDLLGRSPAMRALMARIQRAATSDASVLLLGETGVGKEVVARAIHNLSPRQKGPFETVDCGSMNPALIASELFGHEQGAFTGAVRRHVGIFERADGGTVFLDELGELPLELQTALLGALERRSFRRLGGSAWIPVDVRIVCATNRDLRAEVNAGTFRQDLYYRIAVVLLRLPALRDRLEDIQLLSEHFLRAAGYGGAIGDILTPATLDSLRMHRWPGNVRELRNAIEAMVALGEPFAPDGSVPPRAQRGPSELRVVPPAPTAVGPYAPAREAAIDNFEATYIRGLLAQTQGNVSEGARVAEINRSYLVRLISKHGIKVKRDLL